MTLQTQLLTTHLLEWNELVWFVFFATLFLYAIHRIVGMSKVKDFVEIERYHVIASYKNHILFYAFISAVLGAWFFFQMPPIIWLSVIIPTFISLGYVLPMYGKKRRLRDFDFIKIFLIAFVWAWITVWLPVQYAGVELNVSHLMILFERAFFVFAITIPFDIRDLKVDAHTNVQTIPGRLGIPKSRNLAWACLGIVFILAFANYYLEFYNLHVLTGMAISTATTSIFIYYSDKVEDDYFFTGLIDGTMILQFVLILFTFL